MTPPYVSIKNLEKYQHYKHRNPPWVKLHYSVLDDPAFLALDEVQQCRYIKLIMLASRQLNCISTNPEYLGRVMRISEQVDLTPLINAGFLLALRKRQSSKMLAPPHEKRSQRRVEKSREEPPLPPKADDGFALFWKAYPKKKAKGDAEKAWKTLKPNKTLLSTILMAIDQMRGSTDWTKDSGQFIPFPATWLRRKGWEDEVFTPLRSPIHQNGVQSKAVPQPNWGKTVTANEVWFCGCYRKDPTPCKSPDHGKTCEEVMAQ